MNRICAGLFVVGLALLSADAPAAPATPAAPGTPAAPSTPGTPAAAVRRPAVAPAANFVKSAATLAELEKTLEGKGAKSADLLKPGPTAIEIVARHEDDYEQAELELHDGKDHVFFVTDGQATLTLGGELVAPREVSSGEWKAARSTGSRTIDVAKGDLVFIPHGTVHGRSAKGRRFTMLIVSFFPGGPPAPAGGVKP
jgi:quercetin dioxygenase-like cupin family protein